MTGEENLVVPAQVDFVKRGDLGKFQTAGYYIGFTTSVAV
jgi:hypothetical protein